MSSESSDVCVVLITAPDDEVAGRLAHALVEERLAACVNLVPGIRSVYRWQGAVHDDSEVLLVAKTGAARVSALAARVEALHPYEVPEVIALRVERGNTAYLDWAEAESSE